MTRALLLASLFMIFTNISVRSECGSLELLKSRPLSDIEGLWSMTSEDLLVLILRNEDGRLEITVAPENGGVKWKAGSVVGYLEPSAEENAYWLMLEDVPKDQISRKIAGRFPFSKRCVVRLKGNGEYLTIEKGDVDIAFKPLSFFPKLNRLIRLSFKNPKDILPEGFRKIAPGFDGRTGSRSRPVYF